MTEVLQINKVKILVHEISIKVEFKNKVSKPILTF